MHRKRAKTALKRAVQRQWAQSWMHSLSPTGKLSPYLNSLHTTQQLGTVCLPMHIYDGSLSYVHTYTQHLGWVDSGACNASGHYCTLPALCREALLLYRTGVAPLWITEVGIERTLSERNRFMRVCDYCVHARDMRFVHDAYHVLFECPLFHDERALLCQRVQPDTLCQYFGKCYSLAELHIALLCPPTVALASAVGHFLACSIAKLGMFKALHDASKVFGPLHPVLSVNEYVGKWLRIYRSHVNDVRQSVVSLFMKPPRSLGRSPIFNDWAEQCVVRMDGACSLLLMLPNDWLNVVSESRVISNKACVQSRAKAKAKAKSRSVCIGQIPFIRT